MTLLPKSLFSRLFASLTILIIAVFVLMALLFQYDRENLLVYQFGYAKATQLQALRVALSSAPSSERTAVLKHFGQQHGALLVEERTPVLFNMQSFIPIETEHSGHPHANQETEPPEFRPVSPPNTRGLIQEQELSPSFLNLETYLKKMLGDETRVRIQPQQSLLWIRFSANENFYWAGFPSPETLEMHDFSSRTLFLVLIVIGLLGLSAFALARYITQPLAKLASSVNMVGRGEYPSPLPVSGPSELMALNRGFNAMMIHLKQVDADRAILLAGVSHDLRTPLARLRLGVEMNIQDQSELKIMIEEIETVDRIIDQFLDFSRTDSESKSLLQDITPLIAACVARYRHNNLDVRFTPSPNFPSLLIRTAACERLILNLINNALSHGKPPVEISTGFNDKVAWIDVFDHGAGFPKENRERLKAPFQRGSEARTVEGNLGAGLGLAIVDRIVRLHHGKFDLLNAPNGGAHVRVTLPLPPG